MDLETSPIQQEIDKILSEKMGRPFYSWDLYFRIRKPNPIDIGNANQSEYVAAEEKEDIYRPLTFSNMDFIRDYENNAADEGSIVVTMGLGMWYKVLQPYRDYLELVLTRIPKTEVTLEDDTSRERQTDVFYAIPKVDAIGVGTASNLDRYSRDDLDNKGLIDIEFQLLDLSIEKIRSVTVGGIFRKTNSEDVIKGVLRKETTDVKIADSGQAVETIKIVKADNQEKREHIVIPQGTSILDVPQYLQKFCGGVYSTGINMYLQNKSWYVFPPYNTKRLDQEDKTLTILKVPSVYLEEVERTYRLDGDKLIVIASSDSQFDDKGNEEFKNMGNGVRFADARQYMSGLVKTKDNKAIASRKKLNNEYLYTDLKIGDQRNNNVPLSADTINANPFNENSKLAMREGSAISFLWKNCDASLLYPAMPVRILYLKNGVVRQLHGSLLKVHNAIMMQNKGITSKNYRQQAALFVYAVNPDERSS